MAKNIISCQECTAEIEYNILNEEDLNSSEIKYCPCCGRKMEQASSYDEDDEFSLINDWDDLQETTEF